MGDAMRATRLRNYVKAVVDGKKSIRDPRDAQTLLEAIGLEADKARCIVRLMTTPSLLRAIVDGLRIDLSTKFLNGPACQFIRYITDDEVAQMNGGQILHDLLMKLFETPLMLRAFKSAFEMQQLTIDGVTAYANMLYRSLLLLPSNTISGLEVDLTDAAMSALRPGSGLLDSPSLDVRAIAYKIQDSLRLSRTPEKQGLGMYKPGGRHDNDHEDFRQIAIYPTADELLAKEAPYFLQAAAVLQLDPEYRGAKHLDNQFRLLREEMLGELREDLAIARGLKPVKRTLVRLRGLQLTGVNCGSDSRRRDNAAIALRCYRGFPHGLPHGENERKIYFKEKKTFLKHQSCGCLYTKDELIAFATVSRNEELLAKDPPVIILHVIGAAAIKKALFALKTKRPDEMEFVVVDTPFFAFEPILQRLQNIRELPFTEEILGTGYVSPPAATTLPLNNIAEEIRASVGRDIQPILNLPKPVILDYSQTQSLVSGLTQAVSLMQGPPGTGKSFLGALIAKAMLEHTHEKVLILCYTNHALDQFIEDIMDMGVTPEAIVRLGSKSSLRTEQLSLFNQTRTVKESTESWRLRSRYFDELDKMAPQLESEGNGFSRFRFSSKDILESLEFSNNDDAFFQAFLVPEDGDGMTTVEGSGRAVQPTYLIDRWCKGQDAGVYKSMMQESYPQVWNMDRTTRAAFFNKWETAAISERADVLYRAMDEYSRCFERWDRCREGKSSELIKSKRIVACTTTGAARSSRLIESAKAGVMIVEEAGEVLESHVLTALSSHTKQLIMIGDHQQLRPKVNNFALTIERGDGYDLNRSLFERLVVDGYGHTTLAKQHRMRPEISSLVRQLMYPDLEDDAKTNGRPDVRGLQSNVIFIDHGHMETEDNKLKDRRDEGSTTSRTNPFEVDMVLKIVRYLAQQGYGTDKQVVLTPYLGQLRLLMDRLKADHDPVLNDLDSHDLVRAGLMTAANAKASNSRLRLSTIDNFQGEEGDIVIISLTRANKTGAIGFLGAAQRLNVLLSRARDGLIILGNAETYRRSRKGAAVWGPFLEQLGREKRIFDGLPTKCERHPEKRAIMKNPEDFDRECPDGGCTEPCPALLKCQLHPCPQRCHNIVDHSKMKCLQIVESKCMQNHVLRWKCWQGSINCVPCEREEKRKREKAQRDLELAERRQQREDAYAKQLRELDEEIARQQQTHQDHIDEQSRQKAIEQKKLDLARARQIAKAKGTAHEVARSVKEESSNPASETEGPKVDRVADEVDDEPGGPSEAEADWEYQKTYEGARNEHIDSLMAMIGLESVKKAVLDIKIKVDTSIRQRASLQMERYGAVLLGNPGTGKTTVARLYAKILSSIGVLPGTEVRETTAARLMSEGVNGLKKLLEEVLKAGGGALFIDEAYQLVSGSGGGGTQILDFLLAEVENLTGKLVVILAGYDKQMEDFFAHNPGLPSRFPHELRFMDYEDDELAQILQKQLKDRFGGRMKVEGGQNGLYTRIVSRRVGYGRGRQGFGNARAVANACAEVITRQATRLKIERRQGKKPDDLFLTKEDLIRPPPSYVLAKSKPWQKLKELIGLDTVKEAIDALLQSVCQSYERELREEPRITFNLNRVFLGSPGTGKTTVAKLYGQILSDLGFLSKGEVVVKNPSDFVGEVLGASEKNTKGILASTAGKVLVIDEAYGLHTPGVGTSGGNDPYKAAVIDTIVADVQSVPGEDRCVLLLGYKPQMEAMFQQVNPGLSRRFPISEAFTFEDFTDDQLRKVLDLKLRQQTYKATDEAVGTAMECLGRARNKPNFGNAGEVDILLNGAKARHQKRQAQSKAQKYDATLEAADFDPHFDRADRAVTNVRGLFEGVIGCQDIVARLEGYQKTAANLRARDIDPRGHLPFNFLFSGPPGTGKTTTARKMGQVYYDMGFLSTPEVIDTSATDLVGQYIGQTGPKTQQLLEKSLGKVLFIDEAYRLAEGHFAKEAIDELVDCLTKPAYARRLVVILAGYEKDINRLVAVNPGLTSRFPETILFRHLEAQHGFQLLLQQLGRAGFLDVSGLKSPGDGFEAEFGRRFDILKSIDNWANGRDVETMANNISNKLIQEADHNSNAMIVVNENHVIYCLDEMTRERKRRLSSSAQSSELQATASCDHGVPEEREPTQRPTNTSMIGNSAEPPTAENGDDEPAFVEDKAHAVGVEEMRDHGVSDETWSQLQQDKAAEKRREDEHVALSTTHIRLELEAAAREAARAEMETTNEPQPPDDLEERRRLELERINRELQRRWEEEQLQRIRQQVEEYKEQQRREQAAQRKLRSLGVCVAGFKWIKQSGGYRCAGGSHFVSSEALEAA